MANLKELEEYIDKTEDVQLGMMVDIVKEYGNQIPGIIKAIKEKHVDNHEKEKAEIIFSTVHRCKGMEYDAIQIVSDFITEEKLEKLKKDKTEINLAKINEEINLLYVAVTRTRNSIHISETLMPKNFPASSQIHIMKIENGEEIEKKSVAAEKIEESPIQNAEAPVEIKEKAYSVEQLREKHKCAYKPWTKELDNELIVMHSEDINSKDLAKHFGRTRGAITSRIKKLELEGVENS